MYDIELVTEKVDSSVMEKELEMELKEEEESSSGE